MTFKRREGFEHIATILGFIVDGATVLSWILSFIAAIALSSQPQTPSLPGVNIELGPWYQLVLLLSSAFAYVHFLRRQWIKDNTADDPLSDTFQSFLFRDLPALKRPLLIIPIILFYALWFGIGVNVLADGNVKSGFPILVIGGTALLLSLVLIVGIRQLDVIYDHQNDWDNNNDLQSKWIERIDRKIQEFGSVDTEMFENTVGLSLTSVIDVEQINWAIQMYFGLYEFEQNLELSEEYTVTRNQTPVCCYRIKCK